MRETLKTKNTYIYNSQGANHSININTLTNQSNFITDA